MGRGIDFEQVRKGLVELVKRATDIEGRVEPYIVEKIDKTPTAYIGFPEQVQLNTRFGGGASRAFIPVIVVVGRIDSEESQARLDSLLSNLPMGDAGDGYLSLKQAIESDRTLGGTVQVALVTEFRNTRAVTIGADEYIATDLLVRVDT